MSSGIIKESGLVDRPFDPYWDGPVARKEVQNSINILAENDRQLSLRQDTSHIVVNFLLEKFGITKADLDAFVESKRAQIKAIQEPQAAPAEGTAIVQP